METAIWKEEGEQKDEWVAMGLVRLLGKDTMGTFVGHLRDNEGEGCGKKCE